MSTGVLPTGFVPKQVQDILSDISSAATTTIDPAIDTSPEMPLGQLFGILSDQLAQLWELGATAYNSVNRDAAESVQLDNINGLTGTKRKGAFPSSVLQTCVFSQVGTYSAGSLVFNVSGQPNVQFANAYDVVVAGSGPYTVTENNVVLATGSLNITAPGVHLLCLVDGPTVANASTLTVITTPVTGLVSGTNPADAVLGGLVETDTAYRLRGEQEISAVGSGNPDAMRADLKNVTGVLDAFVLENTSDIVDVYGSPPHSFLVVIWDGISPAAANNDIAQAIWDDKPTGITTSSAAALTGNAVDSNGTVQVMGFDRASQDTLYLTVTVTMLPNFAFNSSVAAAIKQAIVASTQSPLLDNGAPNPAYLGLGDTVSATALSSAILSAGLDVFDVTLLKLGFTASPSGTTNLTVGPLAIALADTSRITVNGL